MKLSLLTTLLFFTLSFTAQADNNISGSVRSLQQKWAAINYQSKSKKEKLTKFQTLSATAQGLVKASPNSAELKIWQAIIMSTHAGVKGGLGGLALVKRAKVLLLEAEKINPSALNGSIYTSMGSMYFKVPGWPIGFGNNNKANAYLKKALTINPRGIDPNYFYGEFLIKQNKNEQAIQFLNTALAAPKRPNRPIADAGRRQEVILLLKKAKAGL